MDRKFALVLALAGLVNAFYLFYSRISGTELVCGISSCGVVNDSPYSYIFGVPVSFFGVAFFAVMTALLHFEKRKLSLYLSIAGVVFSAYLTFLEAFVIRAWCQWCVFSAWITVALFIVLIVSRRHQK